MTARQALTHATTQLSANPHLRDTASRDAQLLLLHTLGLSRAAFLADPHLPLTANHQAAYDRCLHRRLANEPIQYITGEQEFYGLALQVTPAVLIPRPETEHLVEAVLSELDSSAPLHILDVGTGSGAIAIALAHHLPRARVLAIDIAPAALEVAAANAAHHRLAGRIDFLESNLLQALRPGAVFDAIVANPPYVALADRAALHPQVRDFEPAAALFAGDDGLSLYRRLIPQAHAALQPGGLLALEMGQGQRDALAALLSKWNSVRFVNDLQQIPRVALARKPHN